MAVSLRILLSTFAVFCVNGQGVRRVPFNGTNPLIPQTPFSYSVALTFRSARETIGPVCNRHIVVPGSETNVNVGGSPRVSASSVRVPPQVTITGPASAGVRFTLVVASQPEDETGYGSPEKPFVQWIQTDIQINQPGALTLASFVPFIPVEKDEVVLVALYRQDGAMDVNASISSYVDNACELGAGRCSFDVTRFAANNSLSLVFAGYFLVEADQYSVAVGAKLHLTENGCFYLDKFDLKANPLIGDKAYDLKLGVMAKFITPEEMLGPVCGRVFHYKDDKVEVTARTGKPVPARKTRTIPWVWYHTMDGDESWKDDWFTLAYVSQVTNWPAGGSPEKPLLLWLVTNIHGDDVSNGMCDVPYHPAMPSKGVQEGAFLLYKQRAKVEINAADYSESECELQFRCSFNLVRMAMENDLEMVGAQTFHVAADPFTVVTKFKAGYKNESEACHLLREFKHEGKMLGQCLPKFTSWKDMWEKIQKTEDKEEKYKLMEKMKDMCPELEKDFSQDKPFDMEGMKDKMDMLKDWMKEKMEEKAKKEMEMKKYFMGMLMKKMFGEKMDEMKDKSDEKDKDEKKDCGMEMMDIMMKMKGGMDLMKGSWDDKEKEFGPCMKAVVMKLKSLHEEYVAEKKMEYMKEKFEMFMKQKMHEFITHMMMKKMAEHLGMEKCGEKEGEEEKPCADPAKVKMMLWKKYVTMKEMKKGMGEEKKDDVKEMDEEKMAGDMKTKDGMGKEKMMEEMKQQMKELLFFKSVLSMMKEKKMEKEEGKEHDALPALKEFVKRDPSWKRFCDDL